MGFNGGMAPQQNFTEMLRDIPFRVASADIGLTEATEGILYQIPDTLNEGLLITSIVLEGLTPMTGVLKTTTLKIGTSENNCNEIFGATGAAFNTGLGTSLLPVGALVEPVRLLLSSMSVSPLMRYLPGKTLRWRTGGLAPLTTGAVRAHIFGVLR